MTAAPNRQHVGRDDVRATSAGLERQHPGATVWYGRFTSAWWAMVSTRRGMRLVEASSPQQLHNAIARAAQWPWPHRRAADAG
jgi:hypothetical protein